MSLVLLFPIQPIRESVFAINGTSPTVDDAVPNATGYRFMLPEATGRNGEGALCGAVGRPAVEIRFERLSFDGWDWYAAFVGEDLSETLTSLTVYNPWKSGGAGWQTFTAAEMHRPTFEGMTFGGYAGVVVMFSELVA